MTLDSKFQQVEHKLNLAYQRNKRQYDLRRRPMGFSPGDLVWRKNYVLSDAAAGIAHKLAPKFLRPFRVKHKVGFCTYELENDDNYGERIWRIRDLKPHRK